ncbi:MAG: ATP-binding cassette domain-containing protein [Lactococcus raffinolactis]|uniref:ABC transporter ATP-binding protein n=1 Tax=Pseudolactococcus raffinolactis TaxID=1366 RepID=UPI001428981F|nr:ATP-binding cassette domain-containing protein [Lactococcus raffinolactis]MCH4161540.1 ATP-binding cassette domain-containing protein [Lactococcus raffinolactis]MDN5468070.1 ATP-binding cassette domain-containing protein [Lactococcus raffinolactis]MDT2765342.1 ATP-binding cassette domain-containing protein [Lactococcus raffinolactis]MDT2788506.1 ATP-binding cassette domain-containing protein [Lactococcus raffinolactis]
MIVVEHLDKTFKKTVKQPGLKAGFKSLFKPQIETFEAVKDLNFEIPKGEIFGFIGANGAGKSTTIKMLTGILTPTSGTCLINGKNPQKNRTAYVKDIGVVFGQRTQLWWDLALQETYSVLKEIYDISDSEFHKRMAFLNEVLDLNTFIKDPVRTLSLGQRMRADIAASLLHNPKVLFLDEPTIGLDVAVKDNIRKAIKQINQEEQTTILLTTHDLNDIELLCDRIFMIDRGQEIFDGSVSQLKQRFGKMHEVRFEMTQQLEVERLDYHQHFSDLEVIKDGLQVTIQFDATKVAIPDLVKFTLSRANVKDIAVKDADIEEIIRRFFRKEIENV